MQIRTIKRKLIFRKETMLERQEDERSDSLYDIAYSRGYYLGYRIGRIECEIRICKKLDLLAKNCINPKDIADYEDLLHFMERYKSLSTEKIAEHIIKESEFMHS